MLYSLLRDASTEKHAEFSLCQSAHVVFYCYESVVLGTAYYRVISQLVFLVQLHFSFSAAFLVCGVVISFSSYCKFEDCTLYGCSLGSYVPYVRYPHQFEKGDV